MPPLLLRSSSYPKPGRNSVGQFARGVGVSRVSCTPSVGRGRGHVDLSQAADCLQPGYVPSWVGPSYGEQMGISLLSPEQVELLDALVGTSTPDLLNCSAVEGILAMDAEEEVPSSPGVSVLVVGDVLLPAGESPFVAEELGLPTPIGPVGAGVVSTSPVQVVAVALPVVSAPALASPPPPLPPRPRKVQIVEVYRPCVECMRLAGTGRIAGALLATILAENPKLSRSALIHRLDSVLVRPEDQHGSRRLLAPELVDALLAYEQAIALFTGSLVGTRRDMGESDSDTMEELLLLALARLQRPALPNDGVVLLATEGEDVVPGVNVELPQGLEALTGIPLFQPLLLLLSHPFLLLPMMVTGLTLVMPKI